MDPWDDGRNSRSFVVAGSRRLGLHPSSEMTLWWGGRAGPRQSGQDVRAKPWFFVEGADGDSGLRVVLWRHRKC